MAAKLMDLIEAGLDPEQIIQKFKADDEQKALEDLEGDDSDEVFPDEVIIISQALAYRDATISDAAEICRLLNSAYAPEVRGSESCRDGQSVELSDVEGLLNNPTYKWLVVEAPSGKNIELDGVILGASCFSMDGSSRKNGVIEGTLGSIRYLGVLPRYHGFCVGRRLLERVEGVIFKAGCVKSMVCVPSTRTSMMDWIERRGYEEAGCPPYPATGLAHVIKDNITDLQLVRFVKQKPEEVDPSVLASSKPEGTWHLKEKPPSLSKLNPAARPAQPFGHGRFQTNEEKSRYAAAHAVPAVTAAPEQSYGHGRFQTAEEKRSYAAAAPIAASLESLSLEDDSLVEIPGVD